MALNFPINPEDGDTYEGYVYDATAGVWNSDPHQIASRFVTSATAPSNASEGDGWFDTNTAKSYVFYDGVWVQLGALGTVDLNQIADVNVSSPANGQALIYDETTLQWANEVLPEPVLTFSGLDDTLISTPAIGDSLVYNGTDWVNGPRSNNAIINGDFGVWQRGTSFAGVNNVYTADRWRYSNGGNGIVTTISREAFNPSDIEAIGYGDAKYFYRFNQTVAGSGSTFQVFAAQRIEDARTFAGQQVTLSFWAKSDVSRSVSIRFTQDFGSNGSSANNNYPGGVSINTSWQRFSVTTTLDSVLGKTIDSDSYLSVNFTAVNGDFNVVKTVDIWGVQLEAGSVATPFRLAGGSKAAELAECERYYQKYSTVALWPATSGGQTYFYGPFALSTTMRANPSASIYNPSNNNQNVIRNWNGTEYTISSVLKNSNQFMGVVLPSTVDVGENVCTAALILESEL